MKNTNKVKPQHAEGWGWWVKVKDVDSANYAIRMSGLPIFLMGLGFLIASLFIVITWSQIEFTSALQKIFLMAMLPISLCLTASGIMLRKNFNKIAPIAAGLYIPYILGNLFFVAPSPDIGENTMLVINVLFTTLMALLSLGGLRGWLWLRKNPSV